MILVGLLFQRRDLAEDFKICVLDTFLNKIRNYATLQVEAICDNALAETSISIDKAFSLEAIV